MKSLVKAFGIAVLAFSVTVANANVTAGAIAAAQKNPVARKWMAEVLGADAALSAQAAASAIGKLSAAEAAAVGQILNLYASKAADATGNSVVAASNEALAKKIFLDQKGQNLSLATLAQASTNRQATQTATQINACDTKLIAGATGLPEATVLKGYRTQLLNTASTCVLDGKISNAGLANAIESVAFASDFIAQGSAKKPAVQKGLKMAIENDEAVDGVKKTVTADQAAVAVDHLAGPDCQVYQNL